MKFNHRESQRVREPQLHERHQPLTSVSLSQPIAETVAEPGAKTHGSNSDLEPKQGWFGQLVQGIAAWVSDRLEPRVSAVVDQSGQTWWRAYNPRTQERRWLSSETEALLWLDSQPW